MACKEWPLLHSIKIRITITSPNNILISKILNITNKHNNCIKINWIEFSSIKMLNNSKPNRNLKITVIINCIKIKWTECSNIGMPNSNKFKHKRLHKITIILNLQFLNNSSRLLHHQFHSNHNIRKEDHYHKKHNHHTESIQTLGMIWLILLRKNNLNGFLPKLEKISSNNTD